MKIHNRPDVVRTIQEALPAGVQGEYEELETFYCEICEKRYYPQFLKKSLSFYSRCLCLPCFIFFQL